MVFRCLDFLRLLTCYLVADVEWFAVKKILLQFVLGSTKICLSFTGFAFRLHHRQTNEKGLLLLQQQEEVVWHWQARREVKQKNLLSFTRRKVADFSVKNEENNSRTRSIPCVPCNMPNY